MQTTTVKASELGDDWRPSAHMVRALTAVKNLKEGDTIRVREHRRGKDGESRRWHSVAVLGLDKVRSEVHLELDKWPIIYVCAADELVELIEISRTVVFRCVVCNRADAQDKHKRTVLLKDFVDAELVKAGGLHVVILPDLEPNEITGYCKEHGANFLS